MLEVEDRDEEEETIEGDKVDSEQVGDSHWVFLAPRGKVPAWGPGGSGGYSAGPMGYCWSIVVIIASKIIKMIIIVG